MAKVNSKPESAPTATNYKELVVGIPICVTALALTYDVGFFDNIGVGYLSLFSLSEHVVFALEALPITILLIVLVVLVSLVFEMGGLGVRHLLQAERIWAMASVSTIMLALGGAALWYRLFGIGLLLWLAGLVSSFLIIRPDWLSKPLARVFILIFMFFIVFAFGAQEADKIVQRRIGRIYTVVLKSEEVLPVRILRSGERIILVHHVDGRSIVVLKWEEIKRISSSDAFSGSTNFLPTSSPP